MGKKTVKKLEAMMPKYDPVFHYNGHDFPCDFRDLAVVRRINSINEWFEKERARIERTANGVFEQQYMLLCSSKEYYDRIFGEGASTKLLGRGCHLKDVTELTRVFNSFRKKSSPYYGSKGKRFRAAMDRECRRRGVSDA